jgi:hypothetical protein
MFAVQCSFCQHENVPGARFCAECGSPLHLRVCPNSKCGKVSDVNTRQCQYCGTFFPEIPLAAPVRPAGAKPPSEMPEAVPQPKSKTTAWPLIIVAMVAGGLPLLWFNRAHLPAPKGWQPPADLPPMAAPPLSQTVPAAPPPAVVSPPLPPLQVPPLPAAPEATAQSPAQPVAAVTEPAAAPPPRKEQAVKREVKRTKPASEAASRTDVPTRPCTDAVAALGLCDPKQDRK